MNEDVSPKDHRFKIIVVTTIMAALIISIGVWAITSAVNSTKEKNAATNNTETSITKTETETKEDSTSQTTSSNVVSPSSEYTVSDRYYRFDARARNNRRAYFSKYRPRPKETGLSLCYNLYK